MKFKAMFAAASALGLIASPAFAEGWYGAASAGFNFQADSSNSGQTGAFATGNGAPVIPNGTQIAAGTPYGWKTEFDNGYALSAEFGRFFNNGFRASAEIVYSRAGVDTHRGVQVGGAVIDGVDAAVIAGSPTQLGATVGQVVANDDGSIKNTALFANVYYDFNRMGTISPYVGAGLGVSNVDVTYRPSDISIIDGSKTKFAWQVKGGAAYALTESFDVFGEVAYRATDNVTFGNRLFPGNLSIKNEQTVLSVGGRFRY
ncbi:outer membrane beta-barrel protein [Hyphomonas sp.]|uniref:outer membrane beta-barrel protein n=1 Tax=Hyphomonas sp. TaxID=87 RepID=UPI00391B3AFB